MSTGSQAPAELNGKRVTHVIMDEYSHGAARRLTQSFILVPQTGPRDGHFNTEEKLVYQALTSGKVTSWETRRPGRHGRYNRHIRYLTQF